MRALASFRLQRNLRTSMRRTQLLAYSPQPACSGGLAGFISTYFYSSRISVKRSGRFWVLLAWIGYKRSDWFLQSLYCNTSLWQQVAILQWHCEEADLSFILADLRWNSIPGRILKLATPTLRSWAYHYGIPKNILGIS